MKMSMEQHPPSSVEPEMVEELEERQRTPFEESASQLLMMLDEAPNKPADPRYYSVSWDRWKPGHMTSLTNMTVRPTGARKQELYGEFYQAQFEVTHLGQDGSESYDFIWAETGAQRRGNKITPNQAALARDHGYQPLNIGNVAKTLAEQIKTMDDCVYLLRSLQGRTGIAMASGYISNAVNTFTSDFTYRDFASLKIGKMTENVSKLFEMLREAQGFGQDVPKSTQGFLVSRLLRTVADKRLQSDPDCLNPQEALNILDAALDQGVITSPNIKQRVLGFAPLYRYTSAVERLHEHLEDPRHNRGPKNIVGTERTTFAVGFMMARLREEPLPAPVVEHLAKVRLATGVVDVAEKNREILYDLLDTTARGLGIEQVIDLTTSSGVVTTFAYILEALHPGAGGEQRALDQKCVDIIEQALVPIVISKIGEKALLGEDTSLLDDDEREAW